MAGAEPPGEWPDLILVTEVAPYHAAGGAVPGGVHHCLPSSVQGMAELAQMCGLTFVHTSSVRHLPASYLEHARVLALLTIGDTAWSAEQRVRIESRLAAGELAVLALHCASDASADWDEYGQILGARFHGHPVTAELPVAVLDGDHPATAHLEPVWRIQDELYLFREFDPGNRVLLAIRQGPEAAYRDSPDELGSDLPVAWARTYGRGRVFYSALGHFGAAWENRNFLQHVLGGLRSLLS